MAGFDAVFVGAGVNSLTGAALLSRAGWSVCVLERNDVLGGAIRTSGDLTAPGFTHELMASWHPLFAGSAAYAELGDDLHRHGLEYLNTDLPTATLFPDGGAAFLTTSLDDNIAEFERHAAGDGAAWQQQFEAFMASAEHSFGVLSAELWSTQGLNLARKAYGTFGRRGLLAFAGSTLVSARDWAGATFASERAHGLLAPWVLHTGLGPEQALSGFMTQVIACAIQLGGMPVPRGGGVRLVEALAGIVREGGGELRTGADVERVLVAGGRATGVRLTGGETVAAARAVIAGVTPQQLYGELLREGEVPPADWQSAQAYRYGRAGMQIHLALDALPQWASPDAERLARTALRACDARPRRRLARRQRGRARSAAGRGDDRRRPARHRRSGTRAGGEVGDLDPAARAAPAAARRRPRRDRRRRRDVERGAARGLRGSHRRAARPSDHEPRQRHAQARRALARRPRGAQPQPRRRRHLRGLVRPRPEPAVAPDRAAARATPRRSRGSGRSAPPRTQGRVSAPDRAISWPSTCRAFAARQVLERGSAAAGKLRERLQL